MHCLILSDTFPNRLHPWRGPYNRRQMECLATLCDVTVIDPLPWTSLLGEPRSWRLYSRPDHVLKEIVIHHPTFWYMPVLGRGRHWRGILSAAIRTLRRRATGHYDLVLATFAYPHGLAAKYLAKKLDIPYVVKVRGSDLHSLPQSGVRHDLTAEAVRDADAVVAVSRDLVQIAGQLGAKPGNVHLLTNGIDADAFPILPRAEARQRLAIPAHGKIVLSVGALLPVKGLDILVDALKPTGKLDSCALGVTFYIAGQGPMRSRLEGRVARQRLGDSVRLLGHIAHDAVPLWMNAADVLVLPSRNEGCPNVVLEALACGTPVVASCVGAVPDLVGDTSGLVVPAEDSDALAAALQRALSRKWNREQIRATVQDRSWQRNAESLCHILKQVVSQPTTRRGRDGALSDKRV